MALSQTGRGERVSGAASLPPLENPPFLIWEDAEPHNHPDGSAAESWWLARAHHEASSGARDFFVAEDDISGYLLGIMLPRPTPEVKAPVFRVVAATLLSDSVHLADAVGTIKDQVAGWVASPQDPATRAFVTRWRRRRSWIIARTNAPFAVGAFLIGGLMGFAVAMFAVSSGLVGWPMVLAGIFIGASTGSFLKFIADRKPPRAHSPALAGSWGRFAVVTVAAMIGAGVASGSILTLFWN